MGKMHYLVSNLLLDGSMHISFQLSICIDQGLSGSATHAAEAAVVLKDLSILKCTYRLSFQFPEGMVKNGVIGDRNY